MRQTITVDRNLNLDTYYISGLELLEVELELIFLNDLGRINLLSGGLSIERTLCLIPFIRRAFYFVDCLIPLLKFDYFAIFCLYDHLCVLGASEVFSIIELVFLDFYQKAAR